MLILTRYYGEVKNTPDSRTILLLLLHPFGWYECSSICKKRAEDKKKKHCFITSLALGSASLLIHSCLFKGSAGENSIG